MTKKIVFMTLIAILIVLALASISNAIIGCCCDPVNMNGSFADDQYCNSINFIFAGAPPAGKSCSDHCNAILTSPTTPAAQCTNVNYRPAPTNFVITPVKGEKEVNLAFGLICPPDSVKIERCKGSKCSNFQKIIEIAPTTSYIDSAIEWGENYNYKITARFNSGDSTAVIKSVYSGDIECWNKYSAYEFCIAPLFYNVFKAYLQNYGYKTISSSSFTSTFATAVHSAFASKFNKGYSCNPSNVLVNKVSCSASEVCVSGTTAKCAEPSICNEAKLFGLYSSKSVCEGTTTKNYCFFDRSSSSIDACFDCSAGMGCYEYNSKSTCDTDNCGIGDCEWRNVFPDIGTGVCIDKRFNNCKFCDTEQNQNLPNAESFNKVFDSCSKEKSSALSTTKYPCFFDIDSDSSVGCGQVSCTDYSQTECSAHSSGVTLKNDNSLLTYSADSCGIKVCDYNPVNQCFKDADGNAAPDCEYSNNTKACEKDWKPPETSVFATGIPGRHDYLNIKLLDKISGDDKGSEKQGQEDYYTYFCIISSSNQCNNAKSFPIKIRTNSLNLNDLDLQDGQTVIGKLKTGNNAVNYFSTDPSLNREVVKSLNVIACDKCSGPKILKISLTGGKQFEGDYYTAVKKPTITIAFNEPSTITNFSFKKGNQNIAVIKSPLSAVTYNYSFTPVAELAEDTYTFTINAKDKNNVYMDSVFTFKVIIDNSAAVMIIIPADGTVLTTDSTDINISFNEAVNLEKVTLDEMIFLNKYAADIVSTDLTSQLQSTTGRSFRTSVSQLSDGKKEINVMAKDVAENDMTGRSIFFVVTKTPKMRLKSPSWGISSSNVFNIEVETTSNADCRYVYDTPVSPPVSQFTYLTRFTSSGKSSHTIPNFNKIPAGDTSTHLLHVFCKPQGGQTVKETFELSVDPSAPKIISAFAYPRIIVEESAPNSNIFTTTLKVQMSKPGFCKYSSTQTSFDLMENKFSGFDVIPKKAHVIELNVSKVKNYSYNLACKSLADVSSFAVPVSFNVDLSVPFKARSITPRYAPSTTFDLSIETNKRAFCYYGSSQNSINKCFADCLFTTGHTHEIKKTNPGFYQFFVQCNTGAGNEFSSVVPVNITIDNTPPYMSYVNDDSRLPDDSEYSWFADRLRIAFLGNDSETRVTQYQYLIETAFTRKTVKNWTKSVVLDGKSFYVKNLDLEDETKYVVKVKPINVVGLIGNYTSSNGVTVDFEKQPENCINDMKDANETDVDCGGPCGLCNVGQLCNENIDCESGFCVNNICSQPLCDDNTLNGLETDVDCGGTCTSCDLDQSCVVDTDCISNSCSAGVCSEPILCENGLLDNTETGIDCGGACPNKCSVDQSCLEDYDCAEDLLCIDLTCKAVLDTDKDRIPDDKDLCPGTSIGESVDKDGCAESQIDFDNDKMFDNWERQYGLDPSDPSDANKDLDKDGLTNLEEHNLGTDPTNKDSDFDGWSDGSEVRKGFDPMDSESHPSSMFWAFLKWILILAFLGGIGYTGYYVYKKYHDNLADLFKKKEPPIRIKHIKKPRPDLAKLRKFARPLPKKEDEGWIPLREMAKKIKKAEVEPEVFKKLKKLNKGHLPKSKQKDIIKELEKEHVFDKLKKVAKRKK